MEMEDVRACKVQERGVECGLKRGRLERRRGILEKEILEDMTESLWDERLEGCKGRMSERTGGKTVLEVWFPRFVT